MRSLISLSLWRSSQLPESELESSLEALHEERNKAWAANAKELGINEPVSFTRLLLADASDGFDLASPAWDPSWQGASQSASAPIAADFS